ncbi:hypothetical protein [Neobacillus vireti]|uniref:Uncharacterized protein n=1 Tax=Neobacillus vireti LMG 21834 TaxID=1131730 RepID=A0AB94IJ70_9BACI|nr:hypothetical protein [Neobacillus vireti]ETI67094.1 hypothetical protein BAVI_19304 [Neobacillus vireti LMG 21834]KLT19707.1 hypothetical protein AA980_03755 [Neobacillus vireti]
MANKFKFASNSLFALLVLMVAIMLIKIYIDYQNFIKHPEWSAPFSAHLITICVTYGVPLIVALVFFLIFKNKASKKINH